MRPFATHPARWTPWPARPAAPLRPGRPVLAAAVAVALSACGPDLPTAAQTPGGPGAPLASSAAAAAATFQTWHQGFESGAEGWYDAGTDGALGWCGSIDVVEVGAVRGSSAPGGSANLAPSAGRAHAEIRGGGCNAYWSALGIPGGAPYAPGPDAALYSGRWPAAGYVSELDVYLDPAWSGAALGTLGLVLQPTPYPEAVLQLAATIMPRGYTLGTPHPAPHWFAPVEAVPGEAALSVLGHRIEEAGWYTFRFVFSEVEGTVEAAFELRERNGGVLTRVSPLPAQALNGPVKVPFTEALATNAYGPGHLWFFDAPLEVATFAPVPVSIDEHRVRPGR
ncbi:MAG: hypothetical protein P8188_03300 [Gemmatimonadota bacterium]